MAKGSILWFDSGKGYGFIKPDVGDRDIFVHYTGISGEGYRTLEKENLVEFDVVEGKNGKGPQAVNVRIAS